MPPPHRKACRRYDEPGHAHGLTFSCYRRLPLLSRERTCRWLAEAIEPARRRTRFELWAYVFMPEHVHLVLRPRAGSRVASLLWRLKRPVGQKAIAFLEEQAPDFLARLTVPRSDGTVERRFWQAGGGYDRNLVDRGETVQLIEYVHNNPVRRGLVEKPEEWEWSSARWYAGVRPVPLEVDDILPRDG